MIEIPLNEIPLTECICSTCQSYCKTRPCWGTPADIQRLIDEGYADRLMLDWWVGELDDNDIYLIVPALYGSEGEVCPYDPRGTCNFFKDERCEIHSLKPLEGKIASCKTSYDVHGRIAKTWDSKEGKDVVKRWRELVNCHGGHHEPQSLSEMVSLLW